MATAKEIIDDARLDLNDYGTGVNMINKELLNYLNRTVRIINGMLVNLRSEMLFESDTSLSITSGDNFIDVSTLNSGLWADIISLWVGTTQKKQCSVKYIQQERVTTTATGEPYYWGIQNNKIIFERAADQDYSDTTIHYYTKPAILTLTSDMPYSDRYNDYITQALVVYSRAKHDDQLDRNDVMFFKTFEADAIAEQIRRNFVPRYYELNF